MKKTVTALAAASMLFATSAIAGAPPSKMAPVVEPEIIVPEVPVAGVGMGNLGWVAAGVGALVLAAALLSDSSTTTTTVAD